MDFINHLRIPQADEPSSDEESDRILTSAAAAAPTATTPPAQPSEAKAPAAAKRKREAPAEAAAPEGTDAETAQAAKRARVQPHSPPTSSRQPSTPVVANGTRPAKKRAPAAEEAAAWAGERVVGQGRVRSTTSTTKPGAAESSKAAAVTATTAAASAVMPSSSPAPAPSPSSAPLSRKPVDKMEYFERRVHDMLASPLDFDDCVLDSTRPMPRHAARSFAQYRRRQPQPAPPLVMSGALGPVTGFGVDAKSSGGGSKRSRSGGSSLAKEARKNAHRERVRERGLELKGKGKGKANIHGKGAVGKRPVGLKSDGSKGRERKCLSNARQTGMNGGQRNSVGGKKYKKFA